MSVTPVGTRPVDASPQTDSADSGTPAGPSNTPTPQDGAQDPPARDDHTASPPAASPPPIPTQVSVQDRSDASTSSARTHAGDDILQGATAVELQFLNDHFDSGGIASWRNLDNAGSARELNGINMTGYPPYAKVFQNQLPVIQAQIADMPDAPQRERNLAQLSLFSVAFENAADPGQRAAIVQQFASFRKAVSAEHDDTMLDPVMRAASLFTEPFGSGYLDMTGKAAAARLENLRADFEHATTPEQRARAMSQAVQLKKDLQLQIGEGIRRDIATARARRQQTFGEIVQRYKDASSMTVSGNAVPARRLEYFGSILQTQEHALAFAELMHSSPKGFRQLRDWETRTRSMDADAEHAEQGHLFNRLNLPAFSSFSDVLKDPPLPTADYGKNLLDQLQWAQRRIVAADVRNRVKGSTDLNPQRREALATYSPPPPEWQQQLDEAFCRLSVGAIPVVGFFTGVICPGSHLDDTVRTFIDIGAGVLGSSIGVKLPEMDLAGPALRGSISKAGQLLELLRKPQAAKIVAPSIADISKAASLAEAAPVSPLAEVSARINGRPTLPSSYRYEKAITQSAPGSAPGIMLDQRGQAFITADGRHYAVRPSKVSGGWRVFDPDNPMRPGFAVGINEHGEWEPRWDVGVNGGARPIPQETKQAILEDLRSHRDNSYRQIAERHRVSESMVGDIARRNDLAPTSNPDPTLRGTKNRKHATKQQEQAILGDLRITPPISFVTIANRNGVTRATVRTIAAENNISRARNPGAIRIKQQLDQEILDYLRSHPDQNYSQVAAHLKVESGQVSRVAKSNGLERKGKYIPKREKQSAIHQYMNEHPDAPPQEIARATGVRPKTAAANQRRMVLWDANVQRQTVSNPAAIKDRVIQDLRDASLSDLEIATRNGTTVGEVRRRARALGLRRPSVSGAHSPAGPAAESQAHDQPVAGTSRAISPLNLSEADRAQIQELMESWLRPVNIADMLDLDPNVVATYVHQLAPDYEATGYFPYNRPAVPSDAPFQSAQTVQQVQPTVPALSQEDRVFIQTMMGESYRMTPAAMADWIEQPLEVVEAYIRSVNPAYLQTTR